MMNRLPVIAIVGPTASGKSAMSMRVAKAAQTHGRTIELISMDSALVYKGMDIGTAKPSAEEMATVIHHGINICEPETPYSAAKFAKDAKRWISEIHQRGNIPMIVGGTMLYWRALAHGLSDMPPASPEIRAAIERKAAQLGWAAIHQELMQVDPITAERLEINDSQRVQRALEIFLISGKPMSSWISEEPKDSGRHSGDSPIQFRLLSIEPSDRGILHERIAQRFEIMMQQGFLDEMRLLLKNSALTPELPSMRAVGYRQAWAYLNGEISLEHFKEQSIAATRQLAKRQLTWLRGIADREIFDPLTSSDMDRCEQVCLAHYQMT
jgi:tRNA dimethylallyltransferase